MRIQPGSSGVDSTEDANKRIQLASEAKTLPTRVIKGVPMQLTRRLLNNFPRRKVDNMKTTQPVTLQDLRAARRTFEANETRDLFYRAASELVSLSLEGVSTLTLAEALAVLLQTWNSAYYRFRKFDTQHFTDIDRLLCEYRHVVSDYRGKSIEDLQSDKEATVVSMFEAFESVLGPVGAAKCLHLMAPRAFPLWDRAIAEAYGIPLGPTGTNGNRYWRFVEITQKQSNRLGGETAIGRNPLKALDEFNYCRYTKGWLKD